MSLIPVRRPDRNGYIVTRWVKDDPINKTARDIPSVAAAHSSLPFDRVAYVDELLGYWDKYETQDFDKDEITAKFWELEDDTLLAIDTDYSLDSGDGERMTTIYDWVGYFAQEQEEYLRELVTYCHTFNEGTSPNFMEESLACLKNSGCLPDMFDYSQVSPELEQDIRNILSVTEARFVEEYDGPREHDVIPLLPPELISLIMARPDDVERIKEIVTSRNTDDAALVESMLTTQAPAVSEGML